MDQAQFAGLEFGDQTRIGFCDANPRNSSAGFTLQWFHSQRKPLDPYAALQFAQALPFGRQRLAFASRLGQTVPVGRIFSIRRTLPVDNREAGFRSAPARSVREVKCGASASALANRAERLERLALVSACCAGPFIIDAHRNAAHGRQARNLAVALGAVAVGRLLLRSVRRWVWAVVPASILPPLRRADCR